MVRVVEGQAAVEPVAGRVHESQKLLLVQQRALVVRRVHRRLFQVAGVMSRRELILARGASTVLYHLHAFRHYLTLVLAGRASQRHMFPSDDRGLAGVAVGHDLSGRARHRPRNTVAEAPADAHVVVHLYGVASRIRYHLLYWRRFAPRMLVRIQHYVVHLMFALRCHHNSQIEAAKRYADRGHMAPHCRFSQSC